MSSTRLARWPAGPARAALAFVRCVRRMAAWLTLASCAVQAEPPPPPALPTPVAPASAERSRPEAALGVLDRGIFSDLDARLQLSLPARLDKSRVHALHDTAHALLVLYEGDWPIKVYPVSASAPRTLVLGATRLGLRAGDYAELAPLLREANVATLAPGSEAAPGDADHDGIPDPLDVLIGAHKTVLNADRYDGRYERIAYPLGDVPRSIGVCTDVLIRALRNAGIDLQETVHQDILRSPAAYPMISRPNTDIDHRRVKSLLPYFQRHFEAHSAGRTADDPYRPGDIVVMDTFPDRPGSEHVGIVSDREAAPGVPLIINNWTNGTVTAQMPLLAFVPVTARYRVPPRARTGVSTAAGPIAQHTTQLVVALSSDFGDWHARVQRYERAPGKPFRRVGTAFPAVLGASGYGWGDGLHGRGAPEGRAGPSKREGDQRSPAGVFALGTVHGYASSPGALRLPYRQATHDLRCVDDPGSPYYNQIVSTAEVGERWRSAESMRRADELYELTLDIEHNKTPVTAHHGSCIFVHVWSGAEIPVTGCTALAKRDLRSLLEWLKPDQASWVALPKPEYGALRAAWGLP